MHVHVSFDVSVVVISETRKQLFFPFQDGPLRIEASSTGSNSTIAKIVSMVSNHFFDGIHLSNTGNISSCVCCLSAVVACNILVFFFFFNLLNGV